MDDVVTTAADGTFRLIYRSRDRIPADGRRGELGTLFSQARAHNKRQRITGALLVSEDWFVQTLEGDEDAVQALFARIEADPRHDGVEVLEKGRVPAPVFVRWAMAEVADEGEPDIPLLARTDGIGAAAPRGDATAEQEGVLGVMREAARR